MFHDFSVLLSSSFTFRVWCHRLRHRGNFFALCLQLVHIMHSVTKKLLPGSLQQQSCGYPWSDTFIDWNPTVHLSAINKFAWRLDQLLQYACYTPPSYKEHCTTSNDAKNLQDANIQFSMQMDDVMSSSLSTEIDLWCWFAHAVYRQPCGSLCTMQWFMFMFLEASFLSPVRHAYEIPHCWQVIYDWAMGWPSISKIACNLFLLLWQINVEIL